MGENLVEIKRWNEIQEKFTDTFGWERGIELMLDTASHIKREKCVYELSLSEENNLVRQLRRVYNKELKWQEKENRK